MGTLANKIHKRHRPPTPYQSPALEPYVTELATVRRKAKNMRAAREKKKKGKKKSTKKKVDAMNQARAAKRKKDCGSGARKKRR